MAATFTIRQGDRRPWLAYRFGFSLVTATGVTFSLRDQSAGTVFIDDATAVIANGTYDINGVSTVLTPADGVVFYPWGPADTAAVRASCMGSVQDRLARCPARDAAQRRLHPGEDRRQLLTLRCGGLKGCFNTPSTRG